MIDLLSSNRLRFIRLEGIFGYIRGTGPDGGIIVAEDPQKKRPQNSPISESVIQGLSVIRENLKNYDLLNRLLVSQSEDLKTLDVLKIVQTDAYTDLTQTRLWKDTYKFETAGLLALPGMDKMQVKVLGPTTKVSTNVVDALLALTQMNIELHLAEKYSCASSSTSSPIGDCISLKLPRLNGEHSGREKLWQFMEFAGVPDLSEPILSDPDKMEEFVEMCFTDEAAAFREWFHKNRNASEKEIVTAYIDLLHKIPWSQRTPTKFIRCALTTGIGMVPIVGGLLGAAASVIDTFIVDEILTGKSPRFFIDKMRDFSGHIKDRTKSR